MAYNSAYTGPQVDAAVWAVQNKESTWDGKQDKLTGQSGQVVGFDEEGNAVAQTPPETGDVKADGSVPMTGDLNMGGHRITNVSAPTQPSDAVRQSDLKTVSDEVDSIISGATPITLPPATTIKIGGVKIGEGVKVEADGTISVTPGLTQEQADERYLQLSGGTLTGALTLNGEPTEDLQAVPKQYVDNAEANLSNAKGTLSIANGGTGVASMTGTDYSVNRPRGIVLQSSTPSSVPNGCIVGVYE